MRGAKGENDEHDGVDDPTNPDVSARGPKDHEGCRQTKVEEVRTGDRGDVLIRGIWARGTDAIVDVKVMNLDSKTHRTTDPLATLARGEASKKKKHLQACMKQRRHFTPFIVSIDGLVGVEATALMKCLSWRLSQKWHRPHSQIAGHLNARLSVSILRATTRCLYGARTMCDASKLRLPMWEDGAGLGLHQEFE